MIAAAHLLGLLLVGFWSIARPRPRRGHLLLLWWAGLLLMRVAPILYSLAFARGGIEGAWSQGVLPLRIAHGVGAILLLRALVGLSGWDRPIRGRTRVFAGLFALGLAIGVVAGPPGLGALVLGLPWLLSFRWREGLGTAGLALAAATALASFLLAIVTPEPSPLEPGASGLALLVTQATLLAALYSLAALFKTGSRIHLSIRRIGPRLFSSHLLAGAVPFVLAVLFLTLAGALYLSTYRGSIAARLLEEASREGERRLARSIGESDPAGDPAPFGEAGGQILLLRTHGEPARVIAGAVSFSAETLLAVEASSRQAPLLWDGRVLYLRARVDTVAGGAALRADALVPVDSLRMARISRILGIPVQIDPRLRVTAMGGAIRIGEEGPLAPLARAIGPARPESGHVPGGAILGCLRGGEEGWERTAMPVLSSAGFTESLVSLLRITRENPLAWVVLMLLALIALFFLIAIWITITMVAQMGRSITRAVHALTGATAALGQGQLAHRIEISGNDELWDVARQFNQMAERLEQTRAVELQSQRMEEELRLAREIQTRLLPSGPPELDWLELAGISLPARQVGGDYFDYLLLPDGRVGIAIADVSGKGAPAALLMSSFRASLRTQDLAGLGPAEVLGRLNRFIHASVDPGKFITAFLGLIDPAAGTIRYANAGHDPPLMIVPGCEAADLTGGGLILGMLPQIAYEEASAAFASGSLVSVFTDGVTEARSPEGEFFGIDRLRETLWAVREETCDAALRRIVEAVREFSAGEQADDITMILARRR